MKLVMITTNTLNCPKCGGQLKFFDNVKRIVRTKARATEWIDVLAGKIKMAKIKKMHLQSSNVIVVDFKKARKEMGR